MKIELTETQWQMIEHRLTLSDCLADCLHDTFGWRWSDVEAVANNLYKSLKASRTIDTDALNPVEIEVIRDCVDGSTWFCDSEDAVATRQMTRGRLLGWHKSAAALEKKLAEAGIECSFPME